MKPKPFWLLNHFTVPLFMGSSLFITCLFEPRHSAAVSSRFWGKRLVRRAVRGEAKPFGSCYNLFLQEQSPTELRCRRLVRFAPIASRWRIVAPSRSSANRQHFKKYALLFGAEERPVKSGK